MMLSKRKSNIPWIVVVSLLLIALFESLLDYYLPVMHDDLHFWNDLGLESYTIPNRRTLSFILGHYEGCNGRLFDWLGPVMINLLPRGLAAMVMGIMFAVYYYSVLLCSGVLKRGRATLAMGGIVLITFAMPWWDMMLLRVCQFNYVWTTYFVLLFIYSFFNRSYERKLPLWVCFLLGGVAGSCHEQSGVALCATLAVWSVYRGNSRKINSERRWLLTGLVIGTLVALLSPNLWNRVGEATPRPGIWEYLYMTLPILLIEIIVVFGMLFFKRGRAQFARLINSEWGVCLGVALSAGAIALYSGIPGRTGILSESCALVGLMIMAQEVNVRISRILGTIICGICLLLVGVHFMVSILWQRQLYGEYEEMITEYKKSPDGLIYLDFTNRYDVSPLTVYRVKGVPDADDWWARQMIMVAYGREGAPLNILPAAMRAPIEDLKRGSLEWGQSAGHQDSISVGGVTVYLRKPQGVVKNVEGTMLHNYHGKEVRVVSEAHLSDGTQIWISTPWVKDPGDIDLSLQ